MPSYTYTSPSGVSYNIEREVEPTRVEFDKLIAQILLAEEDTGQSSSSSTINAAAGGLCKLSSDIPGAVGHITGIQPLIKVRDDMSMTIDRWFPVNPIHANQASVIVCGILPLAIAWAILMRTLNRWRRRCAAIACRVQREQPYTPSMNKVRGWLLVWCILSTLVAPFATVGYAGTFLLLKNAIQKASLTPQLETFSTLLGLHIGISLIFAGTSIFVGVQVWRKQPRALEFLRRYWWASVWWQGAFVLAFHRLNPDPNAWPSPAPGLIPSFIAMWVWWQYFSKSKRVAAIFGYWPCTAFPIDQAAGNTAR